MLELVWNFRYNFRTNRNSDNRLLWAWWISRWIPYERQESHAIGAVNDIAAMTTAEIVLLSGKWTFETCDLHQFGWNHISEIHFDAHASPNCRHNVLGHKQKKSPVRRSEKHTITAPQARRRRRKIVFLGENFDFFYFPPGSLSVWTPSPCLPAGKSPDADAILIWKRPYLGWFYTGELESNPLEVTPR